MACASSAKRRGLMGVRLREYMAGRRGRVVPAKTAIEGWPEFEKKLNKLGDFPHEMKKELRAEGHRIGKVAVRVLKNKVNMSSKDFVWYHRGAKGIGAKGTGKVDRTVPKGTLRRSIRTWNSRGSKINVMVGPRGGKRFSDRYNAYFAGIVEGGHSGGMNRSVGSRFYNRLTPTLMAIQPRMRRIQHIAYKRVFERYVKQLK